MTCPVLYADMMSQPCRAVVVLCRQAGIDVEIKTVHIGRGETRSKEFKAVNPLGKLPYLVDGNVRIGDSIAIMIYLCTTKQAPDHWYPADPAKQARVNTVLGWHGSTLRTGSTITIFNRVLAPMRGTPSNEALVMDFGLPTLRTALKARTINDVWLADDDYVAGADVSIADLLLATEVDMARLLDAARLGPTFEELLGSVPKVRTWLHRLSQRCRPHYDEATVLLDKARTRFSQALSELVEHKAKL